MQPAASLAPPTLALLAPTCSRLCRRLAEACKALKHAAQRGIVLCALLAGGERAHRRRSCLQAEVK